MRKKVNLSLEIEADNNSAIYAAIGDLLAEVEESNFDVVDVKVEDVPKVTLNIPNIRSGELNELVKRQRYGTRY